MTIIRTFKQSEKWNEVVFMGVLTLFCFSMSLFRFLYTDAKTFLFLNWNLFLAAIPWALTSWASVRSKVQLSRIHAAVLLGSWLLFFPNAPYILTDLFHLKYKSSMPIWFDLVLILSFAWTGLLFGLLSLWDIEKIIFASLRKTYAIIVSIGLLFMSSFGIYLGRFLRWNSWDVIAEPSRLMYDIADRIINPFDHPRTWGVTIFMGLFLTMVYFSFRILRKRVDPKV